MKTLRLNYVKRENISKMAAHSSPVTMLHLERSFTVRSHELCERFEFMLKININYLEPARWLAEPMILGHFELFPFDYCFPPASFPLLIFDNIFTLMRMENLLRNRLMVLVGWLLNYGQIGTGWYFQERHHMIS